MTNDLHLVIANKAYSSWSMRPWIAMTAQGLASPTSVRNAAWKTMRDVAAEQEKYWKCLSGLQKVVADFRTSPRYADAVVQQFEIAEEARSGKKEGTLLFIPMKMGSLDVIKMYQTIIKNAPYGKYAAPSQFAIGPNMWR